MPEHYDITTQVEEEMKWFPVRELMIGQLAEVHPDAECPGGETILRVHSTLVSLSDPRIDWPQPDTCSFLVRLLRPPERVVLSPKPAIEKKE